MKLWILMQKKKEYISASSAEEESKSNYTCILMSMVNEELWARYTNLGKTGYEQKTYLSLLNLA